MHHLRHERMNISGLWVDWGVQEDCTIEVIWRYDHDDPLPTILGVDECRGSMSGTNYIDKLIVTPQLLDHLRDMICERFEM